MIPHKHIPFESLSSALQSVQLWLSRNGASRLMVAAPSIAAMKRQELPDHVTVTPQKRRGPRVKVHSAHFIERGRLVLASWPEDGMDEYGMPFFACVTGGNADLFIADYVLGCWPGDMIYFPTGIPKCNSAKPHFLGDPRGRICDIFWMRSAVPAKGLYCYLCHSRNGRHLPGLANEGCVSRSMFLERLFAGFCEEVQKNGTNDVAVEILSLVVRLFKRDIDEDAAFPSPKNIPTDVLAEENNHPIEQTCLFIDSHLELQLTISSVARQTYLSPTLFTRRFREHTGQSFKEYLTAKRLAKAVQLLQETNMTIYGVSHYVGLKPGQLRNLFREHYSCSPAKFRRQHFSP